MKIQHYKIFIMLTELCVSEKNANFRMCLHFWSYRMCISVKRAIMASNLYKMVA